KTQHANGSWPHNQSPLVEFAGEKAYDTHVAWGLFEAARMAPNFGYGEAAMKNVNWALTVQAKSGWFDKCSIKNPATPATHTLGSALGGVLEGWAFARSTRLLGAAQRCAEGMLSALNSDGFLPGGFDEQWRPAAKWACLTGSVQNATNW